MVRLKTFDEDTTRIHIWVMEVFCGNQSHGYLLNIKKAEQENYSQRTAELA
jgi:hypothetical protein